jgi:hypothetical protein
MNVGIVFIKQLHIIRVWISIQSYEKRLDHIPARSRHPHRPRCPSIHTLRASHRREEYTRHTLSGVLQRFFPGVCIYGVCFVFCITVSGIPAVGIRERRHDTLARVCESSTDDTILHASPCYPTHSRSSLSLHSSAWRRYRRGCCYMTIPDSCLCRISHCSCSVWEVLVSVGGFLESNLYDKKTPILQKNIPLTHAHTLEIFTVNLIL